VKWLVVVLLAVLAVRVIAAPAYVSDELVLGVYAEENNQGQRLATLHSGASVETLGQSGDFTQVRLNDGTTGWVKSTFLTTKEPAVVRVKQLEEELDRNRATTPALAEAAARSEMERLKQALNLSQAQLEAARGAGTADRLAKAPAAPAELSRPALQAVGPGLPWLLGGALIAAACGFWLGYATLARRVKQKFGGIKVY
jgi:hypothetical protein